MSELMYSIVSLANNYSELQQGWQEKVQVMETTTKKEHKTLFFFGILKKDRQPFYEGKELPEELEADANS
jgi:hypothetical protein